MLLSIVNKELVEPDAILLIEAFDRLTREELSEAVGMVLGLVNSGLSAVTMSDEKVWTKESINDLPGFMLSLILLYRGHEESARKADAIKKCVTMSAPNADTPLLHAIWEYSILAGLQPKNVDARAVQGLEAKISEKTEAAEAGC